MRRALAAIATPAVAAAAMAGVLIATHHTAMPSLTSSVTAQEPGPSHHPSWWCEHTVIFGRTDSPPFRGTARESAAHCRPSTTSAGTSRVDGRTRVARRHRQPRKPAPRQATGSPM